MAAISVFVGAVRSPRSVIKGCGSHFSSLKHIIRSCDIDFGFELATRLKEGVATMHIAVSILKSNPTDVEKAEAEKTCLGEKDGKVGITNHAIAAACYGTRLFDGAEKEMRLDWPSERIPQNTTFNESNRPFPSDPYLQKLLNEVDTTSMLAFCSFRTHPNLHSN